VLFFAVCLTEAVTWCILTGIPAIIVAVSAAVYPTGYGTSNQ